MDMPVKPKDLNNGEVDGIVSDALAEAGTLCPVPRYMSAEEVTSLVTRLLPA